MQQHIDEFEPTREHLMSLMSVECVVLDSCAPLNGVYCYIGGEIQSLMSNRKRYPLGQFALQLPKGFATKVFVPTLLVSGYKEEKSDKSDGRLLLTTSSLFLLENTFKLGSAYNQPSARVVMRSLKYLESNMRVGHGYTAPIESGQILKKHPYELTKEEALNVFAAANLFDDEEDYFRSEAPLYELQFNIFQWATTTNQLYGVDYAFGVCPFGTRKSVVEISVVDDRRSFEISKVIICVNLAKFKVQFNSEEDKHLPAMNMLAR